MNKNDRDFLTTMLSGQTMALSVLACILVDKGVISGEETISRFRESADDAARSDGGLVSATVLSGVVALLEGAFRTFPENGQQGH